MKTPSAISFFLSLRGTVGRTDFVLAGLVLALVKFAVDMFVAGVVFYRPWHLHYYLSHEQVMLALRAKEGDRPFFLIMLCLSIPFVWTGIALCVKRSRSAGVPVWFVCLFFVPILKVVLFAMLCLVPPREAGAICRRKTDAASFPRRSWLLNVCLTLFLTSLLGLAWSGFSVYALGRYGAGLFVALPFCLGLIAVVIYNFHGVQHRKSSLFVGVSSAIVLQIVMLALGFEGAGCLIMAAPIWIVCAVAGSVVGVAFGQEVSSNKIIVVLIIGLSFLIPVLIGAEHVTAPTPPVFAVRTGIRINAPPSEVWNHVISFPEISPPDDWVFGTGVAYPIGARIDGSGPGAIRYCTFSTGSFVEPIEVWDEPNLLKFSVTECPPPMREWSPYDSVHPPHLQGFMESRAGQFHLSSIDGTDTWLEGTTWYSHHMGPALYWKIWADFLVHRIHRRVLKHIQALSESR